MRGMKGVVTGVLVKLANRLLPFADAATEELPIGRLLRLSLFQITVGMAIVLVIGTLNRVMIVELGVPTSLVALMISLPLIFAPFRAIIGFRSDTYRSYLGWRRTPFLALGTLLQFAGFAIMPFALILLSGDTRGPMWIGQIAAALSFVLVGAGLHTTQTAGLALATDLAPAETRPKVVALLCMMLLVGMVSSAIIFGALLANFSQLRLIQVVQGASLLTFVLNGIALVGQEHRHPERTSPDVAQPSFKQSWQAYLSQTTRCKRRLFAIALGTAAFSMADVLLEPFGGQILHLKVGATTALTATFAIGTASGLWLASRLLGAGADAFRVSGFGAVAGLAGFSTVIFSEPLLSAALFAAGTATIGFGGGLFAHGTLTASMGATHNDETGLALGAWGSAQATAAGIAIALGGVIRDAVTALAANGSLGQSFSGPGAGYIVVYHIELLLLFATLIVIGPLVRTSRGAQQWTARPEPNDLTFDLAKVRG
jgi:BCD family chlorophyll transporter-like MFS transporter